MTTSSLYSAKDFKSDQYVRWCPGCGDHFLLASLQKAMAGLEIDPDRTAVISGIGCSSRLTYYMSTYGFHTIHGRSAAIATGVKLANPSLSVWQITGDGDCLAIGGNHFIHELRRNIDLNVVLLNNKIYGLTKGQYSPTTDKGFVTKSSPFGTIEEPFRPAELTFGARGNFFARCVDVDAAHSVEVLTAAGAHKGCSVVEVLQNCVIFNDGVHSALSNKQGRAHNAIYLRHGEPMIFGPNREYGIMQDGFALKCVTLGENGITQADLLVHDATTPDPTLHHKLALMSGPDFPVALGVIRAVEAPTYDQQAYCQIAQVQAKKPARTLLDFIKTQETWEVK